MKEYKKRVADALLERKLAGKGAVLIEGPKWCGKTTTAKQIAKSLLDLGDDKVLEQSQQMMGIDSKELLNGETPRLIDEWQQIPAIWDSVRSVVDERGEIGQFILTGSSVPPDPDQIRHSGTGRFSRLRMRPMSLWESGESTGEVSLKDLFEGKEFGVLHPQNSLTEIAYLTCRGGWPQATFLEGEIALDQAIDYYDSIVDVDINRVDRTRRSPQRTRQILRSYARNQGQAVPYTTICSDIKANDTQFIADETVADYVDALKKLFVLEDMPAWNPNLRSKTAVRASATRYFVDPSVAAAALGIGPGDLINDLKTFGMFFEGLAVRDLRIYADSLRGEVFHYRDSNGLECDTVLHLQNGDYALIEIKLGGIDNIEEGAKSLKSLTSIIDTTKMKAPSFMMVLIGVGQYAYRRPDGVYVVPIGCLKP
ncbi:MAG: ATP-binding protein [Bacteroidales bacterium]|nr:ATP-binding protein [Bacteroidales bacterium]